MISPMQRDGRWLLVTNLHVAGSRGNGLRGRGAGKLTFDECWAGDEWITDASQGMEFENLADANQYLGENRDQLESQLADSVQALAGTHFFQ